MTKVIEKVLDRYLLSQPEMRRGMLLSEQLHFRSSGLEGSSFEKENPRETAGAMEPEKTPGIRDTKIDYTARATTHGASSATYWRR